MGWVDAYPTMIIDTSTFEIGPLHFILHFRVKVELADKVEEAHHAEVVTLSLAQKELGTWNLGEPGKPALQLVVNWLPCAMCLGAVLWSGVRSLAIAGLANDSRLEEITGFDEGPRVDTAKELAKRDVEFIDNGAPFPTLYPFHSFLPSRLFR